MFNKYSEIENLKNVHFSYFEGLNFQTQTFVIQDKIDGSNISFIFEPNKTCRIASRNELLGNWDTCNFQGSFQEAVEESNLRPFIEHFEKKSTETDKSFQFYGEIFGPHVLKRCWYGPKARILFFDLRINDAYVTQKEFMQILADEGFEKLLVPTFTTSATFEEALGFSVDFQDPICTNSAQFRQNNPHNMSEGIVVKPYDANFYSKFGQRLVFKRKSDRFSEVKAGKSQKESTETPPALIELSIEFSKYINENRVLSYFSKVGRITNMSQIGQYIKPILDDAEKDFVKDHRELGKDERKFCLRAATPELVKILTTFMAEEA